jgi:predicted component of type VI protein secretion system
MPAFPPIGPNCAIRRDAIPRALDFNFVPTSMNDRSRNVKAKLIRMGAKFRGRLALKRFPVVLGRASEADIYIADSWASRSQCKIDVVDDALVVSDLQSRNGTYVNGERIEVSPLLPGDELIVGQTVFRVKYSMRKSRLPQELMESPLMNQRADSDYSG